MSSFPVTPHINVLNEIGFGIVLSYIRTHGYQ